MSYSQYGLDVTKKSVEAGQTTKTFYDPWSWQQVTGRNMYLCFANWVISKPTIDALLKQQPVASEAGDSCIKCKQKDRALHYQIKGQEHDGMPIGICDECLRWANDYISKPVQIPPGTQFSLF